MSKVTLPPMPLNQAEIIRKIAQKHGGIVSYIITGNDKQIVVEVVKKS